MTKHETRTRFDKVPGIQPTVSLDHGERLNVIEMLLELCHFFGGFTNMFVLSRDGGDPKIARQPIGEMMRRKPHLDAFSI